MLHRAPRLGMNQRQCPELLEGVEGIDFLTSTLIYPIHAESQQRSRRNADDPQGHLPGR